MSVKIRLSDHLKLRIRIRKISKSIPQKIIENAQEIYFDKETEYWIAVKEEKYAGKIRPMIAVFEKGKSDIIIVTVYPSDKKEILAKIEKGRWLYEKQKN